MKYNAFSKNSLSNAFTNQMNTFVNRSQRENLTKNRMQNQFKINTKTFYTQQKSFLSLIYFFFKWIYGVYGNQTVKKLLNEINFGPIWIHCYHLRTLSFTMLLFYISLNYLKKKNCWVYSNKKLSYDSNSFDLTFFPFPIVWIEEKKKQSQHEKYTQSTYIQISQLRFVNQFTISSEWILLCRNN